MDDSSIVFLVIGGGFAVWVLWRIVMGSGTDFPSLLTRGKPALGILLWVDSTAYPIPGQGSPVEGRNVTVDVELPGKKPYEASVQVLYPLTLSGSVLAGATVELRVHRSNRKRIAIVGPGAGVSIENLVASASQGPAW